VKNYLLGAEPRYVCRKKKQKILSAVDATRKYICQGYAPLYLFSTIIYKHSGATHLLYYVKNYLLGA
jgi:hypothetical protein